MYKSDCTATGLHLDDLKVPDLSSHPLRIIYPGRDLANGSLGRRAIGRPGASAEQG